MVDAVRELSGPGVKQIEIAAKAGCSKSQVSLATSLLSRAPDLAEAVSAGRLGLSRASAMAREREPSSLLSGPPGDSGWLPPVFLTVTEAAGKLSRTGRRYCACFTLASCAACGWRVLPDSRGRGAPDRCRAGT